MSIYAWTDLHGRLDLFNIGLTYLQPDDKIYFLGDAADRGPDGWKIIKCILNDKRFTYLKGNHEDLMVKALSDLKPISKAKALQLWYWNGGQVTHNAFNNDKTITDSEKQQIIQQLNNLPFVCNYQNTQAQNVILSHSGYDDIEYGDEEDFIWDRTHFMFYNYWAGEANEIIVHGHTPIELMVDEQEENAAWSAYDSAKLGCSFDDGKTPKSWNGKNAYWYGQGHKCNIDTGALWTGKSILLNLDTWKEIIIEIL